MRYCNKTLFLKKAELVYDRDKSIQNKFKKIFMFGE